MKRLSVMLALLLAFALSRVRADPGRKHQRHHQGRTGRRAARRHGLGAGRRRHPDLRHRSQRRVPLSESRARPVQGHRDPSRLHHHRARGRGRVGRQERRAADDAEDRSGRRDHHRQRRVAGDRHQGDRHVDQLHRRRADQDSDLARSVRADAVGAGRARRSGQHRRQRDRPAVQLRFQGHAAAGRGLDDGRDQHHRHGGNRRVAQLLQLRQLRGDPGVDRRPGHQAADRRHGVEPGREARHQRVPRRRPRLLRQPRDGIEQRARRARRRRRDAGDVGSQQADLRLWVRPRRSDPARQGVVLRFLLLPGRAAGTACRRAGRSRPS